MMATSSTLLLLVVLPALFAIALGVCDFMECYTTFTLVGTDQAFCNATRAAIDCAESNLVNNPECAEVAKDIDIAVARTKKILQCYICGEGNSVSVSVSVSFLALCFGLMLATYFSRSK